MTWVPKATSHIFQVMEISPLVEMSSLMKKIYEIVKLMKVTIIPPPLYKEEQTRESLEKIIAPASFPPPLTHKDQIQCHLHGKAQAKGHHISGVYKKFMRQ